MSQTTKAAQHQRAFDSERIAFENLEPELRDRYDGVFVAVHQGEVVDSDRDLQILVSRFFENFNDASVYIGYVGKQQPVLRIASPSVRR